MKDKENLKAKFFLAIIVYHLLVNIAPFLHTCIFTGGMK